MQIGGAFDAAHIKNFSNNSPVEEINQISYTGHDQLLEEDYKIAREEFGMKIFRDGAWLNRTYVGNGYDWEHLDRLALASDGQAILTISHYEIPEAIGYKDLLSGRFADLMAEISGRIAERYKDCFYAFVPLNEIGYWTQKMTVWPDWWPWHKEHPPLSWWGLYKIFIDAAVSMAEAIKSSDSLAKVMLTEPGSWSEKFHEDYEADPYFTTRPFHNLHGSRDRLAEKIIGEKFGGRNSLLDIVGLNIYHNLGDVRGWPISKLLVETRRQFPDKEIVVAETGICHDVENVFTHISWYKMLERELHEANQLGASVDIVLQAPMVAIADFDTGAKAPGSFLDWTYDGNHFMRSWDSEVADYVQEWNSSLKVETSTLAV